MKQPEKIKIRGNVYKILYNPIDGFEGLITYDERLITISNEISSERARVALGHEIIHAVMYEYDFTGVEMQEELIAGTLWNLLHVVYVSNPEVKGFVFGKP